VPLCLQVNDVPVVVVPFDHEGAHYFAARTGGSLADWGLVAAKPGLPLVCQTCPSNKAHCAHAEAASDFYEGKSATWAPVIQ
jgi:hypothetical protein